MGTRYDKRIRNGVGQLTIVEHALCPLDARVSVVPNLIHVASFGYSDKQRIRRIGIARVSCPLGLSAKDELLLWGLLAITLADPQSNGELHATRHYCLRRLGLINSKTRRGGRQYRDFSLAIDRLANVTYQCDSFYDPIRAEHRKMIFGFFSVSQPMDEDSNRAWRFTWDPLFFEFAQATNGKLRFNLEAYRQLDAASRRMYLFLSKLFHRKPVTPRLSMIDVAEHILGIAKSVSTRDKKAKIKTCIVRLTELGIIRHADITRPCKGHFEIMFYRGPIYNRKIPEPEYESPLFESLIDIGFDNRAANRLLDRYKHPIIREWVDITLAARERFGAEFFHTSGPAFLTDNVKKAAQGKRTPPDWWAGIRKAEQQASAKLAKKFRTALKNHEDVSERALESLDNVSETIFSQFVAAGQSEDVARKNSKRYERERRRRKTENSKQ